VPHSTRAETTRLVAYCIVGLRLATLVQMLPAFATALATTDHRALTSASWVLALGALVGLSALILRRRVPLDGGWAVLDVSLAVVLLVVGCWTVPVAMRTGTWEGFQLGYALCVGCSLLGVRGRGRWLGLLGSLAVAEVVYLAPVVGSAHDVPSVLGNILTLTVLAPLARYGAAVIVRIGAEADEARAYATALATAEEERRARLAIHNGTAVLRLLVDRDDDGPASSDRLRSQAEAEINRMRAYLTGEAAPRVASDDLAALATAVARDFSDLPLTVVADLAQGVRLAPDVAGDLDAALRSLLLNVRTHAGAARVVLHAEEPEDGHGWEVTVHDDGVGFDTAAIRFGVGLGDVVVGGLAPHGVSTTVQSVPGQGTTVTLRRGGDDAPPVDPSAPVAAEGAGRR
jgi:signal transduction histidine kinase